MENRKGSSRKFLKVSEDNVERILEDFDDSEISDGNEDDDSIAEILENFEKFRNACLKDENEVAEAADSDREDESEEAENEIAGPSSGVTRISTKSAGSSRREVNRRSEYRWIKTEWKNPEADFTGEEHSVKEVKTPITYFSEYFNEELYRKIVQATNQHYMVTTGKSDFISVEELQKFIALEIVMGTINFPRIKMYWDKATQISVFPSTLSRNRFHSVRHRLKFAVTENPQDKLWRVRPLIDAVLSRSTNIQKEKNLCVDEMMIPFKGRSTLKQYMPQKPIKWGLKLFALCSSNGIVHDFELYQGKNTEVEKTKMGFCYDIVMRLVRTIPKGENFKLFFDNYFTGLNLITKLKELGIWATGTIRANRMGKAELKTEKDLKKLGRGSYDFRIEKNANIFLIRWYDNGLVQMASSIYADNDVDEVERFCREKKKKIHITRPKIVRLYNQHMGGVDKMDFLLSLYRIFIRTHKWTLRVFDHLIDLAICNSWLEYRRDCKVLKKPEKECMDLLDFRNDIATALLASAAPQVSKKRGGPRMATNDPGSDSGSGTLPATRKTYESAPTPSIRYDGYNHWPNYTANKTRCKVEKCTSFTRYKCSKCNVHLCIPTAEKNSFLTYYKSK